MTNKEKYEMIKHFADNNDVVGVLGAFLVDDAYKDVDFVRFLKNSDSKLFFDIHPMIMTELEKYQKIMEACVYILDQTKVSKESKEKLALVSTGLAEKSKAIVGAAKELCEVFNKACQ